MTDKIKIAISLVNLNGIEFLVPALSSLFDSDLSQYELKLFYWDNGSTDGALSFVKHLEVPKSITECPENRGIVEPRIKLMDEIIGEQKWDAVLEIHSDMLFPAKWFAELVAQFDGRTGILMPHIFISDEYLFDKGLLEKQVEKCRAKVTIYNSIAVHPWLLNINCIQDIGYYNPIFKSHRCEDDDFMLRVLLSKYDIKAFKNSIVFHKGAVIRKKYLKRNRNERIFRKIHGVSVKNFSALLLRNGDPRIEFE